MNCDPNYLMQQAGCFRCQPNEEIKDYLLCQWANKAEPTPPTCSDVDVDAWVAAIVAGGATAPLDFQVQAVCRFVTDLKNHGVWNSFVYINPVVNTGLPGSITTMSYALVAPGGHIPDVQNNLVDADLNNDGLRGDGLTKSVQLGWNWAGQIDDWSTGGIIIYEAEAATMAPVSEYEFGDFDADFGTLISLTCCFNSPNTEAVFFGFISGSFHVQADIPGYYCGYRFSFTDSRFYYASSTTGHVLNQIANDNFDQTGQQAPNYDLGWLCLTDGGGISAGTESSKRLSFVGVLKGVTIPLTTGELQNIFDAVDQLRHDLGGGFV